MPNNVLLWVLGIVGLVLYTAAAGWIWQTRHRASGHRGDEAHFRASLAGLILFTLMTGAAGLGASLVSGRALLQQAQSARWASAEGQITRSDVQSRTLSGRMPGATRWEPAVEYTYTIDGETYTADRIAFDAPPGATSPEAAREQIAAYVPGATVTVFYDPQMPEAVAHSATASMR